MTTNTIRIGCASAFWGDTAAAAQQLVRGGDLDYLVFDYLAEVTMSILAGAKLKNPDLGYATDFVDTLSRILPLLDEKNIKVVSNAGGVNPKACVEAIEAAIQKAGLSLKVALVDGDDLTQQQPAFQQQNTTEMFTGEPIPERCLSINAYLGATPIQAALAQGADIIITGRVVDSAVVLGPLMHEFNWQDTDFDRLAQGSLAGHIIECGTQCTGGNFTDWADVPGYENMGFPIIECQANGSFTVSKPENTGGLINRFTVGEQLLYEIGNPEAYQLPDVTCDFSQVELTQVGNNQVQVSGAKGSAPSNQYKVAATYMDGNRCTVSFLMAGIDADKKARKVSEAIIKRVRGLYKQLGWEDFRDYDIEILGSEVTYGDNRSIEHAREVVVKIAALHNDKRALGLFAKEIAPAATSMAPGITGLVGGRPKVSPVIKLFSFLIPKDHVQARWQMANQTHPTQLTTHPTQLTTYPTQSASQSTSVQHEEKPAAEESISDQSQVEVSIDENNLIEVPLIKLAVARSGDKGDSCNIGVMARKPEYLPFIRRSLCEARVKRFMSHVLSERSQVNVYDLPGINGLNILMTFALGGGGIASLRTDPQGKAQAQQLLEISVQLPKALVD